MSARPAGPLDSATVFAWLRGPRPARLRPTIALVTLLALAGVLMVYAGTRWRKLYWYDVTADYRFPFDGPEVRRVPVRLSPEGFIFPAGTGQWDTALLRLSIRGSIASLWLEPYVVTQAVGRPECRQHFERGARGTRFLNLCIKAADIAPGAEVRLTGGHLAWPDQTAELLLFQSPPVEDSRLLIVAPHPDDAEIAAFGLYAHRDSWVATITTGGYGGTPYARLVANRSERDSLQAALRRWDSEVVPRLGGLKPERAVNLGYFTSTLETMGRNPGLAVAARFGQATALGEGRAASPVLAARPVASSWENLVRDLSALIESVAPETIVFPHPALDANRDHVFTAAAVLEALEHVADPGLVLLLYTNHHVLTEYYPFGPADAAVTLPPWFTDSVPFRWIYSYSLDRSRQLTKLFALDAMHDLRPVPGPVVGSVGARVLGRLSDAVIDIVRDPAREHSYFRRAARPNELFFGYRISDLSALRALIPGTAPELPAHLVRTSALPKRDSSDRETPPLGARGRRSPQDRGAAGARKRASGSNRGSAPSAWAADE